MILNRFELMHAVFCAELCHLIYSPDLKNNKNIGSELLANISFEKDFKYFDIVECDTQAFVLEKADEIYVVFQGSQSPFDWFKNFCLELKGISDVGHHHTGFMDVSEKSFSQIGVHLLELMKKNSKAKVVLTGHSLGGAMATMYAFLLKQKYSDINIKSLITFGQPRCGDKPFSEYLNSLNIDYKRFINFGDYISDTPPPTKFGNWSHAGVGFILSDLEMKLDNNIYESQVLNRIINLIIAAIQLIFSKNFTKEERVKLSSNHDMPLYVKRLKEELARL